MKTVAVRVPDEVRDRMRRAPVDWAAYLRSTIRDKLDQLERQRLLDAMQGPAWADAAPPGSAVRSVREDRDAG